ncbi:MAG TPA: hypothetical protein PLV06_10770 [Bacteroidales bacterium]|nr:hypothetical protein [Bacteroidales bacterium]HPR12857.1 hypothetical protein [Bacteroidales bacterium]HRW85116.1 hypothetical protein [Bacteroidales bacterium]
MGFSIRTTIFFLALFSLAGCDDSSSPPELEYLRKLHSEKDVKRYVALSYSSDNIVPVPSEIFDSLRSKIPGQSFTDPNFGRKWTFIYDGGFKIMNSERNNWNSDTSLFLLETGSTSSSRKLTFFDGKSLMWLKDIIIDSLPSFNGRECRTAFRWMPGDPERLFYFIDNKIYTLNVISEKKELYDEFFSFRLTRYDITGGDGSDADPFGDILIGNKGDSCFVYNLLIKKVVRNDDKGNRIYFDPGSDFPVFTLGDIDYAVAFGGYIFSQDEGISLRDYNGTRLSALFRRRPHMDPTFFRSGDSLFCGLMVRYNKADSACYSALGFPSESGKAYFHSFSPQDPGKLIRFPMDSWPSDVRGSGGQHSCNRFNGSTGIISLHGPALYDLKWQPRVGECFEQAYYLEESENVRRFAHHYIGYDSVYRPSEQPEGWLSPDGKFSVIKTKWGWYRVDLEERMTADQINTYLKK